MLLSRLPDTIKATDGTILRPYVGHLNQRQVIAACKEVKAKYRTVKVLGLNLRGKTDLHGQPYKPTKWIFTSLS